MEGAAISCPWDDARLTWCLVGAVRVPRRYRFVIFAVDNCNCRRYRADNCNRSFNGDGPTQTHSRHTQSHADPSRARQARSGPSDPRSLPDPTDPPIIVTATARRPCGANVQREATAAAPGTMHPTSTAVRQEAALAGGFSPLRTKMLLRSLSMPFRQHQRPPGRVEQPSPPHTPHARGQHTSRAEGSSALPSSPPMQYAAVSA